MFNNKSLRAWAVAASLTVGFGVSTAMAADLKCEPGKLASKYPGLVGKTIRIGQDGESPPYSFRDPKDFSQMAGLDADLARATFKCIGTPVEFVTGAWSGLLPAIIAGQIDVMWDTLLYTPARAKQIDFVAEMSSASGVLVPAGNPKQLKTLVDACGLTGTAGLGTVEEAQLRRMSADCEKAGKASVGIVPTADIPAGARLVQNGRADFLIDDLALIDSMVGSNPAAYARAFSMKTHDIKAVGLTKGNKDLAKAIYDALSILEADGTAKEIFQKYNTDYGLVVPPKILTE
ncbi:transporter substrate-binding domain-containing protein [Labrys monachus]|uniref:Polar amino acid transport system substrate-binding protein n=1 Tax=Labrys monachus TaxID=217067 RepID=A0ABU0F9P8_9HYPH|nr:transporter substrate-binding domain-containing protein [Labrys monachus]MDQ0391339.1 polar amino acid transport system substrate-binding protein [Labrys monachus]